MNIGTKIKEARQTLGITQEQAAEQLLVSRQTVSSWETGKSLPDIVSVIKMSELYHLSLDELLKRQRHDEKNRKRHKACKNPKKLYLCRMVHHSNLCRNCTTFYFL